MPLPRVSLGSFLSAGKAALKTSPISPVTFVIGNESADLDSLCSAVVLAYLRTYAPSSKSNTFYIPLSNIPQADLSIRPELLSVLSRANLKPSDLITLSDLPRVGLSAENTSWVLVDHNSLQGELGEQYGKSVKGCVDHHIEENKVPQDTEDEPRIVKKCGSCTSLVVEYCKEAWDALSAGSKTKSEGTEVWDKELAYLALGPVLIDTSNLQDKSQTTEVDIAVVKYLESKIRVVNGEQQFNPEAYFKEIAGAKRDVSGIDVTGLLRKDYKQWSENSTNLGIASVMTNIKTLIEKAGNQQKFMNICKEFAEERGLSILTVMTKSSSDGQFRRELFVWGIDQKGAETVKAFGESSKDDLNLAKHSEESLNFEGDKEWRRCWQQDRLDYTRKQVAPMMRTAMRGDK